MKFPTERVEARNRFDTFFEEERERLFKALYFVTGNRDDAEELTQEAFLPLVGALGPRSIESTIPPDTSSGSR